MEPAVDLQRIEADDQDAVDVRISGLKSRTPRVNLRVSPKSNGKICEWPRLRKGPYHDLSVAAGAHVWDVYNRMLHPRKYIAGPNGLLHEHHHLTNDVTLWNVAVERQIQVKGLDASAFVEYVVSRDIEQELQPGGCLYVVLCYPNGGIISDPVLLRITQDEFWFSISDSDVLGYLRGLLQGLQASGQFNQVSIQELDVAPLQIQGPKSAPFFVKMFGEQILEIPYYGLRENTINGRDITITRTGFSNEIGFEIYVHDATKYGEEVWNYLLEHGAEFNLTVIAPSHIKRLETGILSYGQDMDYENNPYECRLGWLIERPYRKSDGVLLNTRDARRIARSNDDLEIRAKSADFVGKETLQEIRQTGVQQRLVGLEMAGAQQLDYNAYFYPVYRRNGGFEYVGYVTSIFYSPRKECNIAFAMVGTHYIPMEDDGIREVVGTELWVELPGRSKKPVKATVSPVPFIPKGASGDLKALEL
jgi:glycine cleavage system aminomethyltransferase T